MLRSCSLVGKLALQPFAAMLADTVSLKSTIVVLTLVSTCLLEAFRHQVVLQWFGLLLLFRVIRSGTNVTAPLINAWCVKLTEGTDEGWVDHAICDPVVLIYGLSCCGTWHRYGRQRMFGSVAWGVCSFFVGYLIDQ